MPVYLSEYIPDNHPKAIAAEDAFPDTAYRSQVKRSNDGVIIYPGISSCMAVGFIDAGQGLIGVHLTAFQCGEYETLEKVYKDVQMLLHRGISSIYMAGVFNDRLAVDFCKSDFGCQVYLSKLNDLKTPMEITFTRNGHEIIGTCDRYHKGNLPFQLQ